MRDLTSPKVPFEHISELDAWYQSTMHGIGRSLGTLVEKLGRPEVRISGNGVNLRVAKDVIDIVYTATYEALTGAPPETLLSDSIFLEYTKKQP